MQREPEVPVKRCMAGTAHVLSAFKEYSADLFCGGMAIAN